MKAVFGLGEATPFLGADGIAQDPICVQRAGDSGAGIFATVPIVDAISRPGAKAMLRDFRASFGNTSASGPYTVVAYDATAILYAALDRAIRDAQGDLPQRLKVTQDLGQVSGLAGLTGNLGFDGSGDTTNRVISVFESGSTDPRTPWKLAGTVDYSTRLPDSTFRRLNFDLTSGGRGVNSLPRSSSSAIPRGRTRRRRTLAPPRLAKRPAR